MDAVIKTVIDRCVAEERKAQEELYKLLYSPMLRVCKRYYVNSEDALSAMHNGFIRILDKLGKYRYDKSFMAWSRTVMVNSIIDELRKDKSRLISIEKYAVETAEVNKSSIVNEVEKIIEADDVNNLLSSLPHATRIVFNLFVFEDYSHREIAKALGIAEGTSKWHVASAKSTIVRLLNKKKESEMMRRKERIKL